MKIAVACILSLLLILFAMELVAQSTETEPSPLSLQYGFSLKAVVELGRYPLLHLSANSGIGSNFISPIIYPTVNAELQFYTGGFGTQKPLAHKKKSTLDFIVALTVTGGYKNLFRFENESKLADRNVPLYYFSNFSFPSLLNPFDNSLSLGTNLVWSTNKSKVFQRVGFLNLHPFRSFQISYYNDGPPFDILGLGDKKDRFYTGGGILSYHGAKHTAVNLVEFGYHKFSGYSKGSYEVANRLQHAYVSYKDDTQRFFNRSIWSLTVANPNQHWGVNLREYNNTKHDIQHLIHWNGYYPFHLVTHPKTVSVAGVGYFSNTKIGLR
jgi:hypothetical protein